MAMRVAQPLAMTHGCLPNAQYTTEYNAVRRVERRRAYALDGCG